MEITVTEALRLKNEISSSVKKLQYNLNHNTSMGKTTEDDEDVTQDQEKFAYVEESLIKALSISEEINHKIASFNREFNVDSTVRKLQNAKLLLQIYNSVLQKSKPSKSTRFENLGNGTRKSITVVYTPEVTSKEVKEKISHIKTAIRNFQTEIEKANTNILNLTFEYSDVENLVS